MRRLILGDNPFFGISHLNTEKSKEYLKDSSRQDKAVEIIKASSSLGYSNFMISSHPNTKELLTKSGYYENEETLPNLVFVIPNIHEINDSIAKKGLLFGMINLFKSESFNIFSLVILGIFRRRTFYKNLIKIFLKLMIINMPKKKIEYLCFHNVITDLLLGIGNKDLFKNLCSSVEELGFKPVFITLNPLIANQIIPPKIPLCIYYNRNSYNICPSKEDVIKVVKNKERPWWAMGILASGAISLDSTKEDIVMNDFDSILFASLSLERIKKAAEYL
tara:strand:+ start:406 stop:1236 length:831 start_codon:yes stop_codon:yes gene_type:complete